MGGLEASVHPLHVGPSGGAHGQDVLEGGNKGDDGIQDVVAALPFSITPK